MIESGTTIIQNLPPVAHGSNDGIIAVKNYF